MLPRTQHTHDSSQTPLSVELMMTVNNFVSAERDWDIALCIKHALCAWCLCCLCISTCKQFCHLLFLCMIINMHAFISKSLLNTPPGYYEWCMMLRGVTFSQKHVALHIVTYCSYSWVSLVLRIRTVLDSSSWFW